ncbi:hypothetical protein GN956_G24247 [Arapaima gigas]
MQRNGPHDLRAVVQIGSETGHSFETITLLEGAQDRKRGHRNGRGSELVVRVTWARLLFERTSVTTGQLAQWHEPNTPSLHVLYPLERRHGCRKTSGPPRLCPPSPVPTFNGVHKSTSHCFL